MSAVRKENLALEGLFDWLKRAIRQAAPKPKLPPAEERALIPLAPTPPTLPAAPVTPEPARPFWPYVLIPYVPPPPPAVPPAQVPPELPVPLAPVVPPAEASIWEALFGPPEPAVPVPEVPEIPPWQVEEAAPPRSFFWDVVMGPAGPIRMEDWTREYPDIVVRTEGRMPLWIAFNLGWRMPTTMQLVKDVRESWDLPMLFEHVLSSIEDPYWQRTVEESTKRGEAAELEIQRFGDPWDPYKDAAQLFGIPDAMIEFYTRQPDAARLLVEEIFIPLFDRFEKAMEILKPRGLRGSFEVSPSFDGSLWLKYKESS